MGNKRQWQRTLGVLIVTLAVLPTASPSALPREKDSQVSSGVQQPIWVPLRLYRGYLVVVKGKLGDLGEQNLLVDTGTAPSIVNARVARDLNLQVTQGRLAVLNNLRVPAGKAVLPRVEVGPIQITDLPVMVRDLTAEEKNLGFSIAAVVGLDVLAKSDFRIDYEAGRLVFGGPPRDGFAVPLNSDGPLPIIDMRLNQQSIRMLVDTGAAGLVLFETRAVNRVPVWQVTASRSTSNLSGDFLVKEFTPGDIVIGGRQFVLKKAYLAPDQPDAGRPFDGLIGVGALGFKSIAFDFENHRVYLRP
jgi:predicted aspartyl protease